MKKIGLLNLLTFLAAFLLFQIELITAKILLPNYGGSFMVWGACMVFFQAALLAGYAFSHSLLQKMGIARYKILYLVLLVIPLFFFPGTPLRFGLPQDGLPLSLDIFWQLMITIGPVFFVLSTVSLLTQVWLSSSELSEKANPYSLYGWSNFGSFSALLTYPFFFEFYFDLRQQVSMWRVLYFFFVFLNVVMFLMIPVKDLPRRAKSDQKSFGRGDVLAWLFLSAGGVMMFLSVTNIMTLEIAPFPLLWMIPLAIYLLAFVLNFKRKPWCPAWIKNTISWTLGFGMVLFYLFQHPGLPIIAKVLLSVGYLFVTTMYCQNQLILRKPKDPQDLTYFYLIISLGGFLGGVLSSWVIQLIFASIAEFIVALILIALTTNACRETVVTRGYSLRMIFYFILILFLWPLFFLPGDLWGLIFLVLFYWLVIREISKGPQALVLTLMIALVLTPFLEMSWENKTFVYKKRNYYGIYKVFKQHGMTILHHGTILHGMQFQDPAMGKVPTAYFGVNSPVGVVLLSEEFSPEKIAVIGLGAGTLAAYFHEGQSVDFYELDRDVLVIAEKYFSFTKDMTAAGQYFVGDARVSLTRNSEARYDVLVVDAFSGDAVPTHLLTQEMFEIYRQRLSPGGIVLLHLSNRYLDLPLVAGRVAEAVGGKYCYLKTLRLENWEIPSNWMALTWDDKSYQKLIGKLGWQDLRADMKVRPWSDQYTNVVPLFKWDIFIDPLKSFVRKSRE